jgi:hypothetical protein
MKTNETEAGTQLLRLFGQKEAIVAEKDATGLFVPVKRTNDHFPEVNIREVVLAEWREYTADRVIVSGCLYSARELPAAQTTAPYYSFFDYSECFPDLNRGSVYADTNMAINGQLPAPEAFLIKRFGLLFSPSCSFVDVGRIAEQYALSLMLGQRFFHTVPVAALCDFGHAPSDLLRSSGIRLVSLDIPLIIAHGIRFSLYLAGMPFRTIQPMRLWGVFEGTHMQGIC